MSEHNDSCGWVKLWHRRGVQVTIPLRGDITTFAEQIDYLFDTAQFLAEPPGLEQGESKETVGWIVRSSKQGRTGVADVLHLYADNDGWTKPFLTKYLNNDAERAEFAAVAGFPVSAIPEYIGEGRLERGKNPSADRLIYRVPRPFIVIFKPNPKYDPQAAAAAKANPNGPPYTIPKKVFVRWDAPSSSANKPVVEPSKAPSQAQPSQTPVALISKDQWGQLCAMIRQSYPGAPAGDVQTLILAHYGVKGPAQFPVEHFQDALSKVKAKFSGFKPQQAPAEFNEFEEEIPI